MGAMLEDDTFGLFSNTKITNCYGVFKLSFGVKTESVRPPFEVNDIYFSRIQCDTELTVTC